MLTGLDASMTPPLTISYEIDASDRLIHVNERWSEYAQTNNGEQVMPDVVLGETLWNFISDSTTQDIYRRLVLIARQGRSSSFRYRCDAPRYKRMFQMNIGATERGTVEFKSTLLSEEERPAIALLMPRSCPSNIYVRICSWCHVVAWPGEAWKPLETAAERVVSIEETDLPELTHGICEACARKMLELAGSNPPET
jgi:hypothetical protein